MASEFKLALDRWQQHCKGLNAAQKQLLRTENALCALELEQHRFSPPQKKLLLHYGVEQLPPSLQLAGRFIQLYRQRGAFGDDVRRSMLRWAEQLVPGQELRAQSYALYSGHKLLFQAPPAELVCTLFERWCACSPRTLEAMACQYQKWMQLQPFVQGSQLLGLFWLKMMLRQLQPELYELPLEHHLKKQQGDYQKLLWQDTAGTEWSDWLQQQLYQSIRAALPVEQSNKTERNWFDTEDEIIRQLKKDNRLSARQLALQLGLSCRAIEKQLAKLKARGQLQRIGPAKGGRWLLN